MNPVAAVQNHSFCGLILRFFGPWERAFQDRTFNRAFKQSCLLHSLVAYCHLFSPGHSAIFAALELSLLPQDFSVVGYATDAVKGDELRLIIRFYLHSALLQAEDAVSLDSRSVAWSAPIDILHAGSVKIELRVVAEAQQDGATGSHL